MGGSKALGNSNEAVLSCPYRMGDDEVGVPTKGFQPLQFRPKQLTEDEQRAAGVLPEMIRLSIGLEDAEDLLWDLDQALAASQRSAKEQRV